MVKPSDFILNTDYATLKNDNEATVSVTAPGSAALASGGSLTYSADRVIGSKASINRVQISSTKDSNIKYGTNALIYSRTGSLGSYSIYAYVFSSGPDTVRFQVLIPNPYGAPMTTEAGDETFNFDIDTFIPPFA